MKKYVAGEMIVRIKPEDITYTGGESRKNPGVAVDYMLTTIENPDTGEDIEIYVETEPSDDSYEYLLDKLDHYAGSYGIALLIEE